MLFSMSASADKVIITGSPVVVNEEAGVYVPTTTVTTGRDYYYFTVGGAQRICYQEVNPTLSTLTANPFQVRINNQVVTLQCYDYSPDYFVIQ